MRYFQNRVAAWVSNCFGSIISQNRQERNFRFIEEALELVQSLGMTQSEVAQVLFYVFNRPTGDPKQEVGGTLVTLAALCAANGFDMEDCAEVEIDRCWTNMGKIRDKQRDKKNYKGITAT